MRVRLQKYLAASGVESRRKSEGLILEGRVEVNGKVVTELGAVVDDAKDTVKFDGVTVKPTKGKTYIMLNKPEGCVTTVKDQFGRATVIDYVRSVDARLVPVGRLDYGTSGLLLLTDDGELCYMLTHPKHNVKKTYIARITGSISSSKLKRMRGGLLMDGKKTSPAEVYVMESNPNGGVLSITISEGRNRQVRKMCEAVDLTVVKLKRVSIGELTLEGLGTGEYRELTRKEVEYLYGLACGTVIKGKIIYQNNKKE